MVRMSIASSGVVTTCGLPINAINSGAAKKATKMAKTAVLPKKAAIKTGLPVSSAEAMIVGTSMPVATPNTALVTTKAIGAAKNTMMVRKKRFKLAPSVGTNSKAMNSDADKVMNRVIGRNFMNSPMIPGKKIMGPNAANVVAVDAMIGQLICLAAMPYASRGL